MLRDLEYIHRRARQERAAADAALDERSRQIHLELATRYEEILRAYGVGITKVAWPDSARPANDRLGGIAVQI